MRVSTLVKADKQLVKQAHELGANVRRIVDLALEDYIRRNECLKPEIKAVKRPSRDCNSGMIEGDLSEETKRDISITQIITPKENSEWQRKLRPRRQRSTSLGAKS